MLLPGLAVGDVIHIKDSKPQLRCRVVEMGCTRDEIMWCSKMTPSTVEDLEHVSKEEVSPICLRYCLNSTMGISGFLELCRSYRSTLALR
jgi:hypothetical protein